MEVAKVSSRHSEVGSGGEKVKDAKCSADEEKGRTLKLENVEFATTRKFGGKNGRGMAESGPHFHNEDSFNKVPFGTRLKAGQWPDRI